MPYKNKAEQREYQRKWLRRKRQMSNPDEAKRQVVEPSDIKVSNPMSNPDLDPEHRDGTVSPGELIRRRQALSSLAMRQYDRRR